MILDVLFENAINWPSRSGIAATLVVATLLVITGVALTFRKWIWLGRGIGFVGFCLIMAALLTVREQTITEKPNESITVKRFRYTERTRGLVLLTMIALPGAALAVMWIGFRNTRHRLRGQVPRHLKAGRRFLAQKDYESALREYNQAIHNAPHLAEAYCQRGSVYQAMGKSDEAIADFDRAILGDPRLASAYLQRGKMRTETGDYDDALADFGRLMLMRGNDPDLYLHRGICLAKKGLVNDAVADFHRVLKLTNHSDFAEPAKSYLRQYENQVGRSSASSPNGPSA
jgi:TPR repeat/Tetratricopeptide repeat